MQTETPAQDHASASRTTYGQILKSSVLIGGSSIVVIAIGIVRTKVMAILLGPAGIGLFGLYGSVLDLALSIAGMGIKSSGVRQIAAAVGTGDNARIALTVVVLRRTTLIVGLLGALVLAVLAEQVSTLTFGDEQHAGAVVALAFAVFFSVLAGGRGALLQGMRRIPELAMMGIWGALCGTAAGIPLVYFFREDGIVPSLIVVAATSLCASWWYSRTLGVEPVALTGSQVRHEAASLLKLGFAFMASGCLMMGAAYTVRVIVLRYAGLEAAGLYQAAWTLGGLYIGFVLQAMGTDFYPRLVSVCHDDAEITRLVNEQAHVSMLLAAPGVIGTLTLAPLVLTVFYSGQFDAAVGVLRWLCVGMAMRVLTWPMGFIIVAKGDRPLFYGTELAWTMVYVGLSFFLIPRFGLNGAGIAFTLSYVFHGLMIYPIAHTRWGFRLSSANQKLGLGFFASVAIVFLGFHLLHGQWSIFLGVTAVVAVSAYSIRSLLKLVSADQVPRPVLRLLRLLRLKALVS
jgi:enterobacterial common antigen flippase